ncbi:hypothetical protein FRC17_001919, partial [Serendipita sp. 399]
MPPRRTLWVHSPYNDSGSSEEQSDSGMPSYGPNRRSLQLTIPSTSFTGNMALEGLIIQTPISPSALISTSLPSNSHTYNTRSTVPQLSLTERSGPAEGTFIERLLPELPTRYPPGLPQDTTPILSSGEINQDENLMSPLSAGSGYNGGAEDTPHYPSKYGFSQQALGRVRSLGRGSYPSRSNTPSASRPLTPRISSSSPPPPAMFAPVGIGSSTLVLNAPEKNKSESKKERDLSTAPRPGAVQRPSRANNILPPQQPPPLHLPPPAPTYLASSASLADHKRLPGANRVLQLPVRTSLDAVVDEAEKDRTRIASRPGT